MAHGYGRYDNNNNNNYKKKSGQIPRFGEWEEANEMPITQYFENPRQAGLIRHHHHFTSSSSSTTTSSSSSSSSAEALKLASHHPRPRHRHPPRQTVGMREKRGPQRRVRDVSAHTEKYYVDVNGAKQFQNDVAPTSRPPKPVDEDLYKIPPDLIHSSRRKRMPGFLACLVPCA